MKRVARTVGEQGEALAAAYLQEQGYHLVERNARTPYGELDLVMQQVQPTAVTVFVEVKTRRSTRFGWPEASITTSKRQHLLAAAQAYLQAHPQLAGDWRIDVIAVLWPRQGAVVEVTHFENAITD